MMDLPLFYRFYDTDPKTINDKAGQGNNEKYWRKFVLIQGSCFL